MSSQNRIATVLILAAACFLTVFTTGSLVDATTIYVNFANDTSYDTIPSFGTVQTYDLNDFNGSTKGENPVMITNESLVDSGGGSTGITLSTTTTHAAIAKTFATSATASIK